VVVFDSLARGWRDFVRWGELIEGDLMDAAAIGAAVGEVRPDVVAHFAALAYVEESVADPARYYANNVGGTLNLLEAMRGAGTDKVVFSSTCATYGVPTRFPIDEGHPQSPINPYGRSKLMAERIFADYSAAYGIAHVALRYFNAAGAHPSGDIGERHEPETHLIPLAIEAALRGEGALKIFGSDFDTRDGTAVRDYIHVDDLADAHLRAMDHLQAGRGSDVFNLGTGVGTTVAEVAAAVERVSGKPLRCVMSGRREGDPPVLVAAADKAAAVLGWKPRNSDIGYIIETAWRWHEKELGREKASFAGARP
jgi:UDP-arabinose 4-epimerase